MQVQEEEQDSELFQTADITLRKYLLVVLSGAGMPVKRAIKKAMEWYPEVVEKVE